MSDPSTAAANALGASVAPPPPPKEDGTPQPVATGRMCTNGCGKQAGTLECPKCQASVPGHFLAAFLGWAARRESLAQSSANMVAGANRAPVWTLGAAGYAMSTAELDCSSLGPRRDCSIEQRRNQLPSSTLSRRTSITPLRIEDEQTETRLTLSYFTRHSDSAYPARSSAASNALLPTVSWLLSRHD